VTLFVISGDAGLLKIAHHSANNESPTGARMSTSLTNEDLQPPTEAQRTWRWHQFAALRVGIVNQSIGKLE